MIIFLKLTIGPQKHVSRAQHHSPEQAFPVWSTCNKITCKVFVDFTRDEVLQIAMDHNNSFEIESANFGTGMLNIAMLISKLQ